MQLLKAVKSVERALGRRPGVNKGPRPIDIDILLYENVVVRTAALTIPHERMNERRFVLDPLAGIGARRPSPGEQEDRDGNASRLAGLEPGGPVQAGGITYRR